MAKAFSVASWNVKHFKSMGVDSRVEDVVGFLKQQDPDVFALYEVEGREVFEALVKLMPDYGFHITEGPQVQEILVGVRQGLTSFFTQKTEFKGDISLLRPGALLTVTLDGVHYPLLFLHTKSGDDPRGLGIRDDMAVRAVKFGRVLAGDGPAPANYVFMGDLNVMGMAYAYVRDRDIPPESELQKLERESEAAGLRVLLKNAPATWWGGGQIEPSNLDQVVAASHLSFRQFDGADVSVRGWPEKQSEQDRRDWIERYSDHALLYFEVERV